MRHTFISLIAVPGVLLAAPVAAQDKTDGAATQETDAERVVCKRFARTGTRIKEKFCYTQAQWDMLAEEARSKGQNMQSSGGVDHVNRGG